MIKLIRNFAVGLFFVILGYDIYNNLLEKSPSQILVVKRDLELPEKIEFKPVPVVQKLLDFEKIPPYAVCGLGLTIFLFLITLFRRNTSGSRECNSVKNGKYDTPLKTQVEEKTRLVILKEVNEGVGSERVEQLQIGLNPASRISDLSSLYEDVLSQNLIDVLFIKTPQEINQVLSVNLSCSPQNDNLVLEQMQNIELKSYKNEYGVRMVEDGKSHFDGGNPISEDEKSISMEENLLSLQEIPLFDEKITRGQRTESKDSIISIPEVEKIDFEVQTGSDPIVEANKEAIEILEMKQSHIYERIGNLEDITCEWDKRLDNIESIAMKWTQRMDMAESELSDLHEKMYTILSKLEEPTKQNYIVLSSLSKEAAMIEQDALNGIFDVETSLAKYVSQGRMINENIRSISQMGEDNLNVDNTLKCLENKAGNEIDHLCSSRSIGLDAILEKYRPSSPPKKTSFTVPPHVLPPYKRSSFTTTENRGLNIRKTTRRTNKENECFDEIPEDDWQSVLQRKQYSEINEKETSCNSMQI